VIVSNAVLCFIGNINATQKRRGSFASETLCSKILMKIKPTKILLLLTSIKQKKNSLTDMYKEERIRLMRKKSLITAVVVTMMFALAGCGKTEKSGKKETVIKEEYSAGKEEQEDDSEFISKEENVAGKKMTRIVLSKEHFISNEDYANCKEAVIEELSLYIPEQEEDYFISGGQVFESREYWPESVSLVAENVNYRVYMSGNSTMLTYSIENKNSGYCCCFTYYALADGGKEKEQLIHAFEADLGTQVLNAPVFYGVREGLKEDNSYGITFQTIEPTEEMYDSTVLNPEGYEKSRCLFAEKVFFKLPSDERMYKLTQIEMKSSDMVSRIDKYETFFENDAYRGMVLDANGYVFYCIINKYTEWSMNFRYEVSERNDIAKLGIRRTFECALEECLTEQTAVGADEEL